MWRWTNGVVTPPKVQSQAARDLPVVLDIGAEVNLPLPAPVQHLRAAYRGGIAQQEVGKRQTRTRRIGTRSECRAEDVLTIEWRAEQGDRKSTRLNSSHLGISYAVF